MKNIRFLIIFFFILQPVLAQRGYRDSNRIGIAAGINYFTLNTTSFTTKPALGWNAGLSVRGNFHNDWDIVYAMQFSQNNFMVATTNTFLKSEEVEFSLPNVQISLQGSYKIIANHLSVEFGPIIQANGNLDLKADSESNIVNGTTLTAKDLKTISKFNIYPTVGITFGVKLVRANISYQYGLVNILNKLDDVNNNNTFRGNAGILNGNIIFYL